MVGPKSPWRSQYIVCSYSMQEVKSRFQFHMKISKTGSDISLQDADKKFNSGSIKKADRSLLNHYFHRQDHTLEYQLYTLRSNSLKLSTDQVMNQKRVLSSITWIVITVFSLQPMQQSVPR